MSANPLVFFAMQPAELQAYAEQLAAEIDAASFLLARPSLDFRGADQLAELNRLNESLHSGVTTLGVIQELIDGGPAALASAASPVEAESIRRDVVALSLMRELIRARVAGVPMKTAGLQIELTSTWARRATASGDTSFTQVMTSARAADVASGLHGITKLAHFQCSGMPRTGA